MKIVKQIIVIVTIAMFITFIAFHKHVDNFFTKTHYKELPILSENRDEEDNLTSLGILLVGISSYTLASTFEKK
ncbi:hypothetical protein [Lactobacillus helveticus]|uniref:hypothetical protein n=1 Tax=Lactobacillus helveticus TaxID=1587 RepID=UPI0030CFB63A